MLKLLKVFTAIGPGIKSWIWSDGKFNAQRALILLAGLAILSLMYHFLGEAGTVAVLEFLDELSDMIGYAE